jgi:hypothetical protein
MWTSRSAFGNGNGSSSTTFATLKIAVFAPIARAIVSMITIVNTARGPDPALRA